MLRSRPTGGGPWRRSPIPEGYRTLTTYLSVDNASGAIEWYERVFGAKERVRMDGPEGTIGHAALESGDSLIMLADAFPQSQARPPKELGGTTAIVFLAFARIRRETTVVLVRRNSPGRLVRAQTP